MLSNKDLKRYNKKHNYSYTFGAFPTFELLENKRDVVEKVIIHSTAKSELYEKAKDICDKNRIPFLENDKLIEKIREKDNCILVAVFKKYKCVLNNEEDHVVLVNPSDYGNVGTIIRTCAGFGINNLAIIEPAIDIFNPKVIRSSMGSIFHINFKCFSSFEEYYKENNKNRMMYPFMLKGAEKLGLVQMTQDKRYSLIFGNEASGLDDSFLDLGQSVLISHSDAIDSLNLSLAAGIAIYEFTKTRFN